MGTEFKTHCRFYVFILNSVNVCHSLLLVLILSVRGEVMTLTDAGGRGDDSPPSSM